MTVKRPTLPLTQQVSPQREAGAWELCSNQNGPNLSISPPTVDHISFRRAMTASAAATGGGLDRKTERILLL